LKSNNYPCSIHFPLI